MYDIYECNVRHKSVNYSRKVIVLHSDVTGAISLLCVVVNMNATILGHAWRRLWLRVISSRT